MRMRSTGWPKNGRPDDDLKVFQVIGVIVGATRAEAQQRYQETAELVTIENAPACLGRYFDHHDFSAIRVQTAFEARPTRSNAMPASGGGS